VRKNRKAFQKEQIRIYKTSLQYNSKYTSDTDRALHLIHYHKVEYTLIDCAFDKKEFEALKLKDPTFPIVKVYDVILGGYQIIQDLHDSGLLGEILEGGNSNFFI
jgi:hypothetical protein